MSSLPLLYFWTRCQLSRSLIGRHVQILSFLPNNTPSYLQRQDNETLDFIPTDKRSRTTTSSTESANHCKRPVIFKEGPLVNAVDCKAIFKNDKEKIKRANNLTVTLLRKHLQPKNYLQWTQNCSLFKFHRGYITDSISEFEREFPVAFSILMYKDIEMFERLLRAIYRPQNYYCIHVDAKTRDDIFKAVLAMTECFENVFMASQRIRVKWGKLSVLTPELVCMDDLLRRSTKWKYFINLTGQEFPLKSNFELVKILTAFNGSNDVECDFKGYTCICVYLTYIICTYF
ncbi:hypothetical protein DPMN_117742 [Dreissena polymorpha]|uniref:Beta-1,3-galactosyl-O-glycosyl-glycoprotein beta-1,6-N-acetylglucosaminyltransferase n=1 Tax=Dreissena polymorpha TaxID=45954 RepID=A0A9D4JMW6_DREPO|nr:hypothetical protein DPMN_117742 [Dreissena polymorpha]